MVMVVVFYSAIIAGEPRTKNSPFLVANLYQVHYFTCVYGQGLYRLFTTVYHTCHVHVVCMQSKLIRPDSIDDQFQCCIWYNYHNAALTLNEVNSVGGACNVRVRPHTGKTNN